MQLSTIKDFDMNYSKILVEDDKKLSRTALVKFNDLIFKLNLECDII
jgi:hypothetical protein